MILRKILFLLVIVSVFVGENAYAQKPVKREKHRTGQNDVIKDGDQNWGVKQGKGRKTKITKKGRMQANAKKAKTNSKTNKKRYEKPQKRVTKKRYHSKKAKKDVDKFEKEVNTISKEMKKEDKTRRKRSKQVQKKNRKIPETQKLPRRKR